MNCLPFSYAGYYMTVVFYADVTPLCNKSVFDKNFEFLPEIRKEKIICLKNNKAKVLSLGAWVVLEKCAREFGINADKSDFSYFKNGKPHFAGYPNLHISISHSANIALCAVSDFEIGVDTEYVSDFKEGICRRFFCESECNQILSAQNIEEKRNRFYRMWALKESYSKLTGRGIGEFKNFEIDISGAGPYVRQKNTEDSFFFYEPAIDGYKSAVCIAGKDEIRFGKINIID